MSKASDVYSRKLAIVKCFIQENQQAQHKINKKAKFLQALVCRIKRSLDSKCEYENSRVGKCGRRSKFTVRTERKLILIVKANRIATKLKISQQTY